MGALGQGIESHVPAVEVGLRCDHAQPVWIALHECPQRRYAVEDLVVVRHRIVAQSLYQLAVAVELV